LNVPQNVTNLKFVFSKVKPIRSFFLFQASGKVKSMICLFHVNKTFTFGKLTW